MKNKSVLFGVLGVIIIVVIVIVVMSSKSSAPGKTNTGSMNMSTHSSTSQGPVATTKVTISNFAFSPASIKVKVGDTVTWTNKDSISHTVTADTASADAPASDTLAQGQSYSFTFKKAGTYTYHCEIHPDMKGTVTVQ